jgi:cell division septation protein DedD
VSTPRPVTPLAPAVTLRPRAVTPRPAQTPGVALWRVQAGAFLKRENAQERVHQLSAAGFDSYILPTGGLFKVFAGAFADRALAMQLAGRLRAAGFETLIVRQ